MGTTNMETASMTGAAIQGMVKGGQFPISGSTIGLWVAGSSGYGSSGGNNLLMTPVTTATDGSFTISNYTCPSASSLVYLTASGGNPGLGGANNSAIMLVAPLGQCSSVATDSFINVNEVTTAAAAVALGQFFTPTFGSSSADSFGTSSTNSVGLANAFATVNSLVSISTGAAVTSATLNGTGTGTGLTVTTTPESAKLNTIANILAACVNSDGGGSSPCQTTLFPDVTPMNGTAPTDTLQAAVYMSLNPASNNSAGSSTNLTALYGLQTPTAPFAGVSTQPTDWTVGIQYTASSSSPLLSEPQNIAADASGNIWVANNPNSASNSLTELSPNGTPMVNTLTGTATETLASLNPRNIAIDTTGNVWVTSSSASGTVFEYTTSGTINSLNLGKASYGLAIDGNNNVFVGEESTSTTSTFFEFLSGNLSAAYEVAYPSDEGAVQPEYMAIDTSGNVWATSGSVSTAATTIVQLSNINVSSCGAVPFAAACTITPAAGSNTFTTITAGPLLEPWAPVAASNGLWIANATGNDMTFLSLTGATVNSGTNFGSTASLNAPRFPAVDGAGNVWVGNRGTGAVSEFSSTGTILSPGTGFAHSGLADGNQVTLDLSGNVWVANNSTNADANSIFEIVGSGAPTVTPIALSLKNGKVGQKP